MLTVGWKRLAKSGGRAMMAGVMTLCWGGSGFALAQADRVAAPEPRLAAETSAEVQTRIRQVCEPFEAGVPENLDLKRTQEEVDRLQQGRLPGHMELACQGWWTASKRYRIDGSEAVKFQGTVAASLVWLGRLDVALPILIATREQMMPMADVGRLEVASLSGMIGNIYIIRRELMLALENFERAMAEQAADPKAEAQELRWTITQNYGVALMANREYEKAERILTGLLTELDTAPSGTNPRLKAWVLNGLVNLESRRERFDEALRYSHAEVAWLKSIAVGGEYELPLAYVNMGTLLAKIGRYEEAEKAMRAGISIPFQRGHDYQDILSDIRASYAEFLLHRGKPAAAIDVVRDSLTMLQASQIKGSAREMNSRRLLAGALAATGDIGAAVEQFRFIRRWIDSGDGEVMHRIGSLTSYAHLLIELGDYEEARDVVALAQSQSAQVPAMRNQQAELLRLSALLKRASGDEAGMLSDVESAKEALHKSPHDVHER